MFFFLSQDSWMNTQRERRCRPTSFAWAWPMFPLGSSVPGSLLLDWWTTLSESFHLTLRWIAVLFLLFHWFEMFRMILQRWTVSIQTVFLYSGGRAGMDSLRGFPLLVGRECGPWSFPAKNNPSFIETHSCLWRFSWWVTKAFSFIVLGGFFVGFPPLISLFVPVLKADSFCKQVGSKPNLSFVRLQQMRCSKLVAVT